MDREKQILEVSMIFKLLSNPMRLGILCYLTEKKEMTVNEIREYFPNYSQPSISQQLQSLKANKIVKDRKQGQYVYYSIAEERILKFMDRLYELYCKEGEE
ncbi:ArsR/SmtB family transcription factor [Fusobacterium necrophorum]|uniref:HTH arsR-type domain-containing protein n=1 Tax=Fusobacterium necrophorum DJ-2 TaxID=1441737 RepID=A0AB73C895_9FUSO|nr:metalloregulator ArsR/SmtB family transcription factor [Fusobacterium necrophorum]KDE61198.1 hypothetical protein FUSO4_12130 [Fusobacterium necrophorum DJ-1]KDE73786.1 hypothetical protein FUSO8_00390 [Fusobacterium necrophorum DJ-2]MBR8821833.1 Biofilm growth-associated repressor [Fusobacterium necrophorum]MCF0161889.1 helix-turn-helix transcriptional regulator [Fusobacterium necrophorum]